MRSLLALGIATFTLGGLSHEVRADPFKSLLEVVPKSANAVVAVDHERLASHPHHTSILKFLRSQGWATTLLTKPEAKMTPGKNVLKSVTFRAKGRLEATVVTGKLEPAAMREHFQGKLGDKFLTGTQDGVSWFSVGRNRIAAELSGGRLVVMDKKLLGVVTETAAGKSKSVSSKGGFGALKREASNGDAVLWAVSYVPKGVRSKLTKQGAGDMAHVDKLTFSVRGASDMKFTIVGHTHTAEGAEEVSKGLNGKIQRKIIGNALLRTLGVAALARRAVVFSKGKTVTGMMGLTEAQVGVLTKLGARVLKALK